MRQIFGRQRPAVDIAALVILFLGFCAMGIAVWAFTLTWAGVLLPLAFVLGIVADMRGEIREVELADDALLIRTFFRTWPIPRDHITAVTFDARGAAIDVLNGSRYYITPQGADDAAFATALQQWWNG
jgi:hypothetical protein